MAIVAKAEGGAILAVKVAAGASRERIVGPLGERLKIAVRKPPQAGAANRAVCALVAAALDLRPGDVAVLRGSTRPEKDLYVRGMDPDAICRRLGIR